MSVEFCDTNVVVYAYDSTAGTKREEARALLQRLWQSGEGAVSVQILQELFVTLTRKVTPALGIGDARRIITDIATWQVFAPTAHDVIDAIDAAARWRISFWDAMLLVSAQAVGASVVWSEDLNAGQAFNGVLVQNPFR